MDNLLMYDTTVPIFSHDLSKSHNSSVTSNMLFNSTSESFASASTSPTLSPTGHSDTWTVWEMTTAAALQQVVLSSTLPATLQDAGVTAEIERNDSFPQRHYNQVLQTASSAYGEFGDVLNNYNSSWNNSENVNSTLLSVTESAFIPYEMRPETYIVPLLFAFIFIVGVVGNGTLIVVFMGVRQMRNVPNTYILSLALADLLVILTAVPVTSTVYTVESWPYGSFLCTLSEFTKDVSIGVSVFTLTALSGDRYFAIVDPLRKFHAGGGKRATRMTIAIAVSIWGLAMLCGIPSIMGSYLKPMGVNSRNPFLICYPFPEEWGIKYAKTMIMLRFLIYYLIPLVIIAVFYILIARHLMYSANVPGEIQGAVRQVRARRKVAVTVLAFVVIFGICFLPYHVFMLWFYFYPNAFQYYNTFWHVLRIVGFCLSFINSCANPVALYFVSGAFRKHFNRYLFCKGTVRHIARHDTMCMHRNTSLTSTASKRCYSRRLCNHQSTIRSRLQDTTITIMPNACNDVTDTIMSSECSHLQQQEQLRFI